MGGRMDVIEKARDLAQSIREDARCRRLQVARASNDADPALQRMIGEFNLQKLRLRREYQKQPNDAERIHALEGKIRDIYAQIMQTPGMREYAAAKAEMDELNAQINAIIQLAVTGEMAGGTGCSGNCAGCPGCRG